MRNIIELKAYAKLNLMLAVKGVDQLNYHILDSLMCSVSLYDTLRCEGREEGGLELEAPLCMCEPRHNIVYKAYELLNGIYSLPGARLELIKRIPVQAGMGGGSADAAAALLAFNSLFSLGMSEKELACAALRLGADVPFALSTGMALAGGVGEELCPVALPSSLHMAVAKGEGGLGTAEVFAAYDSMPRRTLGSGREFYEALRNMDAQGMQLYGGNDLQEAALSRLESLSATLEAVAHTSPLYYAMTGSGSAVFGIYRDEETAVRAAEKLRESCAFAQYVHSM